jgi:hypothetical protein
MRSGRGGLQLVDREIHTNTTSLLATALWILSVLAWGISWLFDQRYIAVLSLLICGAAGTVTVRAFFIAQTEQIRTALIVTGRDQSEGGGDVLRLR